MKRFLLFLITFCLVLIPSAILAETAAESWNFTDIPAVIYPGKAERISFSCAQNVEISLVLKDVSGAEWTVKESVKAAAREAIENMTTALEKLQKERETEETAFNERMSKLNSCAAELDSII